MASDVPKDRLEVKVLEARNLEPPKGSGGSVNPYTHVECSDDFQTTDVKSGDTNPKWNSEIMVFDSITAREVEYILLTVRHKDVVSYSDKDLGVVPLPLATALQSPGITLTDWHPLRKSTRMDNDAGGEIKISITYFLDDMSDLAFEDDFDEEEDLTSTVPNAVKVTVESARQLKPPGSVQLCDAYVVLQCGKGSEKACKPVRKNNYPKFGFEATFYNKDSDAFLYITIKHKTTISSQFIGQARISMIEIAGAGEKFQQWVQLVDDKWGFTNEKLGEVQITAEWVYDRKLKEKRIRAMGIMKSIKQRKRRQQEKAFQAQLAEIQKEEDAASAMRTVSAGDSDEEAFLDDEERKAFEEEAEAAEREAKAHQLELEERLASIKPGDYQMQVHVIEGRDLKGENLNGTSDPVVYIECMGKKQHTKIIKNVTNCLFGDTLYFTFKDMTIEQISEAVITVSCYDANRLLPNTMIGTYSLDFVNVYLENDHEFYRQWVPVVDNISKKDIGVQGLIKLSIAILGPGDRQKVHDLEDEIQKELKKEAESGGLGGLTLAGPSIQQELNFLVVTVLKAEDLPNYSSFGAPSIKARVQVDFAGNPPARSKYRSCTSREGLSLFINQELHLPVYVPAHADRISVSFWQHSTIGKPELISTLYYDFTKVEPAEQKKRRGLGLFRKKQYIGEPPKWGVLYGAPQTVKQGKDSSRLMNRFPDLASHYRGRMLLGMYIDKKPDMSKGNVVKVKKLGYEVTNDLFPKTAQYVLRATVLLGSEIPVFKFPNKQGAAKMKVIVSIGRLEMHTEFKSNRKGLVEWNAALEEQLELPTDPLQMPDIFLYLVKGPDISSKEVSFCRVKPVTLLDSKFTKGPTWFDLESDPTKFGRFGLSEDSYPGSLLVRLGFGWMEHAREVKWPSYTADLENKKNYGLRVNVFQCRNLPSSDENGQLDPYVKVRFCGRKKKTKTLSTTADPCFYEVLEFAEELPENRILHPNIIVQIWDRDRLGHNSQVAGMHLDMSQISFTRSAGSKAATPQWYPLMDTNGKPGEGEILISAQLILKKGSYEKLPKPADITPKSRPAFVEVVALGVRDLQPLGFSGIGSTFVEFEINADGESFKKQTKMSKTPNSANPNYSERLTFPLQLPEDYLYAPQLTIRVYEKKLGVRKLLGVCPVDIANKLPWNDENYEAPQQHAFRSQEVNIDDTQSQKEGEDGEESSDDEDDGKKKKKKKKKKEEEEEEKERIK